MTAALKIRSDRSAEELRGLARRERDGRVAARLYAIASALEGMSRAEAARLAGMERQALRDAVVRYNAEGLAGLRNRPKGRPPRRLTEGEEATLAGVILRGPNPERDGTCAWTPCRSACPSNGTGSARVRGAVVAHTTAIGSSRASHRVTVAWAAAAVKS
jgi:Winged helix-turn helix